MLQGAMAFNSSLQVFQKMDSMASELHTLRASEEKLRAERRSIFAKLREVSQKLELAGPGTECDLSSFARALGELMADLGPQSDEAAENGAADGAVAVGPRSRPASSSTSVAALARATCPAFAPDSAADGGAEVPPTPSSSLGSSSSAAVADDTDNCDTAGARCAAGRAHRAQLPRQGLDDGEEEEEEAEGQSESEASTTSLSQKGAQFQTSSVMQCPRYWQADTSNCMVCAKAFGPFRRRHHCRSCGRNCCHQCSPFKVRLIAPLHQPLRPATDRPLMDAYRVCSDCHDEPLEGVGQE